jgi:hypothetical protein
MNTLSLLVLVALVACMSNTVSPKLVTSRASSDFGCDAGQVTVVQVDSTTWKAAGCGKQASYKCWTSPGMGDGTCTPEGAVPASP